MRGGWQQPLPDMPAPPPARAWRRLEAPEGYPQQWRRLAEAALELGLGPEQLGETGLEPLAAARGWKPATVALYSKVARYGGIALPSAPTPEPDPPALDLRPLTGIRSEDPEDLRAVAWCALALAWPAPVGHFRSLRREQVRATTRRLLISTDDGEWAVPGALTAWHTWETVRGRFPALAASPWVLPALRRGPGFCRRVPRGPGSTRPSADGCRTRRCRSPSPSTPCVPPSICGRPPHRPAATRRRSWRTPTSGCPTTRSAAWRWPPAPHRCLLEAWSGRLVPSPGRRGWRAELPRCQISSSCSGGSRDARPASARVCTSLAGRWSVGRARGRPCVARLPAGKPTSSSPGAPVITPASTLRAAPPFCRSSPCRASSGATRRASQPRYSAGT